ncbi:MULTISPECIES: NUDIX hydrolase [Roseobacteraceae]|uniref:NUDIX hydrolase n=1 Tax=Roseobacteraceae TaxID=2854170 RepID=UPI0013BB9C44|nr:MULTISPECIES: NUDIX hydrolase [unclassified Salipiger]NDV53729.1 NUDIX hydrolase [Salipiger sp. PrR003]NDW35750.1 NUDIX hydrolase [Salipiger sp. PrR007]
MFAQVWNSYIAPLLGRPNRVQIAALCHRVEDGRPEVLMITSRTTKRWILPKGWPVRGTDGAGTALQEAWEEAGVKHSGSRPFRIGQYRYSKIVNGLLPVTTDVDVYAVAVEKLLDAFPEMADRERRWMSPDAAAQAVEEEQLKSILADFPALVSAARQG